MLLPAFANRRGRLGLTLKTLACALMFAGATTHAQDMPLADVLIDGEAWALVAEGYAFTDGAATDAEGNFYFADGFGGLPTTGRLNLVNLT